MRRGPRNSRAPIPWAPQCLPSRSASSEAGTSSRCAIFASSVNGPPAREQLGRDPYLLEASLTGVFAVGDVRSSSVKRVASAVGEGSIAIRFATDLSRSTGLAATGPRPAPLRETDQALPISGRRRRARGSWQPPAAAFGEGAGERPTRMRWRSRNRASSPTPVKTNHRAVERAKEPMRGMLAVQRH
jgi:hypothetical protein